MSQLLTIIVGFFAVAVIVAILIRVFGVHSWDSSWGGIRLKFAAKSIPHLSISLGNNIGLVVSTDGETRKIHLNMVIVTDKSRVIDNFKLILRHERKFRIKQFYTENRGLQLRYPDQEIRLPLRIDNETLSLRAEFETYDYEPFDLADGVNEFRLFYSTEKKMVVKKFKVNLAMTNKRAVDYAKQSAKKTSEVIRESDRFGRVAVMDIPILLRD